MCAPVGNGSALALESDMKRSLALLFVAALFAGCGNSSGNRAAGGTSNGANEMRTIDDPASHRVIVDPPPVLTDEGPPPKPPSNVPSANELPPPTQKDEEMRAALPFAPAIAMDPIDGSKISIRADTPRLDLKSHVYYFSSEENKRNFEASPEQYLKGAFSRL
jgi:YHS domain-containing protein